nr:MAG TPA: hypothetical protein [Caudoviricetes sp.]
MTENFILLNNSCFKIKQSNYKILNIYDHL